MHSRLPRGDSVGCERCIRCEKCRRMAGKRVVKLEEGAVSGVRVREKYSVRKVLGQPIRVRNVDHFVVEAIDDERGLMDVLEIAEAVPVDCSHSRNAAIWAAATSGPEAGSTSSFRCASRSINPLPAAWLDDVGAKKIFCNTAYPLSVGSARCLARVGFS